MIPYDNRTLWDYVKMLCKVRGSVYRHVIVVSLFYGVWGVVCSFLAKKFGDSVDKGIGFSPVTHTVLSPAISFLLVYRVQLAYGRYWEARGVLASFAASAREFCSHVMTNVDYGRKNPASFAHRVNLIRLAMAFSRYNNAILRSSGRDDGSAENFTYLRDFLIDEERELLKKGPRPRSTVLGSYMREAIGRAEDAGMLKQPHLQLTIQSLNGMQNHAASMQRIMATPVPIAFTQALEVGLFVFTVTLPFVFIPIWKSEKEPYAMPIIMFFFSFVLYGLKNTSYEIEDPFGDDDNDLPLIESQAELESEVRELLRQEKTRLDGEVHVMSEEDCASVLASIEQDSGVGLAFVSRRRRISQTPVQEMKKLAGELAGAVGTAATGAAGAVSAVGAAAAGTVVGKMHLSPRPPSAAEPVGAAVPLVPAAAPETAADVEAPPVKATKPLDPAPATRAAEDAAAAPKSS